MNQESQFENLIPPPNLNQENHASLISLVKRNYTQEEVFKLREKILSTQDFTQTNLSISQKTSLELRSLFQLYPFIETIHIIEESEAIRHIDSGIKTLYSSSTDNAFRYTYHGSERIYSQNHSDHKSHHSDFCDVLYRFLKDQNRLCSESEKNWLIPMIRSVSSDFKTPFLLYQFISSFLKSGIAAIHLKDRLEQTCFPECHYVLKPGRDYEKILMTARLAADVLEVPLILISQTNAYSASHILNDTDPEDHRFIDWTAEKTKSGYLPLKQELAFEHMIKRACQFAPYADVLWYVYDPKMPESWAEDFSKTVQHHNPDILLASDLTGFAKPFLDEQKSIIRLQNQLAGMRYKLQFMPQSFYPHSAFNTSYNCLSQSIMEYQIQIGHTLENQKLINQKSEEPTHASLIHEMIQNT